MSAVEVELWGGPLDGEKRLHWAASRELAFVGFSPQLPGIGEFYDIGLPRSVYTRRATDEEIAIAGPGTVLRYDFVYPGRKVRA